MALHMACPVQRSDAARLDLRSRSVSPRSCPDAPPFCPMQGLSRTPQIRPINGQAADPNVLVSGLCVCKETRETPVLGGGGPICALAPTDSATVPVRAVLWLDDEHAI